MGFREIISYIKIDFKMTLENFIEFFRKPFKKEEKFRFIYILLFLSMAFSSYFFIKSRNMFMLFIFFFSILFYNNLERYKKGLWKNYRRKKEYGDYSKLMKEQKRGKDFLREKYKK